MEDIDNQLEVHRIVTALGYMDLKHFQEFRAHAAMGLLNFGDLFARSLGEALRVASTEDSIKIIRYWNAMCEHYVLIYRMYLANEKANAV